MPNEIEKVLDSVKNDQAEFNEAFEDILGKTDEEVEETLRKANEKEEADREAGSATKDGQNDIDTDANYSFSNDTSEGLKPKQEKPAEGKPAATDWEIKANQLKSDLDKEKQRTASWDGRIKAANEKTKALEAQVATLIADRSEKTKAKTAEQDLSDQEKIELFKENFPELGDVIDIQQRRIDKMKPAEPAKVETKTEPVVADTGSAGDTAKSSTPHYDAIIKVHPDIDEMVNTGVLTTWINNQEGYYRENLEAVMKTGNAEAVIKMATEFKRVTKWKSLVTPNDQQDKQDKLKGMLDVNSQSGGPKADAPDNQDFDGTAKEIGL